jgi:hypothetical protein
MIVYHNLFQNDEGKWCVEYTENNEKITSCFDKHEDAVKFYMS